MLAVIQVDGMTKASSAAAAGTAAMQSHDSAHVLHHVKNTPIKKLRKKKLHRSYFIMNYENNNNPGLKLVLLS